MATTTDEKLLETIRDRRVYCRDEWSEIKAEAKKDMLLVSGNPWTESDKKQRTLSGRPVVTFDEFGQYINQVINYLRMNKRGIKVTAKGGGANDATARFRQGKIRDIEYRSNAQQAYTTMAADAIQRSYGYLKVTARRVGDGWNQEPVIQPIVNPDLIEPDPDFLRSDGTDWKYLFEYRPFGSVGEFTRRFPNATKQGFDSTDMQVPGGWYDGKKILLASYWSQDTVSTRTKLRLKPETDEGDELDAWEDEYTLSTDRILNKREVEKFQVTQYLTNGFEILSKKPWAGQSIPYVGCYGKILYVDGKRVILSMVRLARDPAMLLNFTRAKQMETVGALLSFPYFFVRGSLTQESIDLMAKSVHEPVVAIPVEPSLSGETQYPQKQIGEPAIQALEMLADAMRRAIQAGMGQGFLPTDAQRPNNKSGTALDTINSSAQRGSFHFSDHYNEGVTRTGVIIDEVLPAYVDTEQETSIRNEQDEPLPVRVNAAEPPQPAMGQMAPPSPAWAEMNKKAGLPAYVPVSDEHLHDITISVGPAEDSQRTMVNDLVQSLVNNAGFMQEIGPQKGAKVLAMSLKTLNAGPQVDAIAAIIDPPEDGQPNPQALQQKLQQQEQELGAAKDAIGKLSQEIATKKADLDSKERIAFADNQTKADIAREDRAARIEVARISAAKGVLDTKAAAEEERIALGIEHAFDEAQANKDRAHEVAMAHVGAAAGAAASAQDHDEALATGEQGHAQALEQGDQGQAHALEQGEQAAALAPPPAEGVE